MASSKLIISLSFAAIMLMSSTPVSAQLSATFYAKSCPHALYIVKAGVALAVAKEKRMAASLLRLHFHDCFVNGCDGSVLLDDSSTLTGEKTAVPNANNSARVALGRRDSRTASKSGANNNIPPPTSSLSNLIAKFQAQGLSTKDMVALAGAHTIGQSRCTSFRTHIYKDLT